MAQASIKISQISKDFNMKSKDVIDVFASDVGVEKKSGATVDKDEFELFLNKITNAHQIKNIDDYIMGTSTIAIKADSKPEAEAKAVPAEAKEAKAAPAAAKAEKKPAAAPVKAEESAKKESEPAIKAEAAPKVEASAKAEAAQKVEAAPKTEAAPKAEAAVEEKPKRKCVRKSVTK